MPEIQKRQNIIQKMNDWGGKVGVQKRKFLFMLMETDFLSMHFDPVLPASSSAVTKTFVCCHCNMAPLHLKAQKIKNRRPWMGVCYCTVFSLCPDGYPLSITILINKKYYHVHMDKKKIKTHLSWEWTASYCSDTLLFISFIWQMLLTKVTFFLDWTSNPTINGQPTLPPHLSLNILARKH